MLERIAAASVLLSAILLVSGGCTAVHRGAAHDSPTSLAVGTPDGASIHAPVESPAAAPTLLSLPLQPVGPPGFVVAAPQPTDAPVTWPTSPPTPTPDPYLVIGPPVRLAIPSIGVDAAVELVGLTSDGAMDVPKAWGNVGWYRDGYRPGEPGNAVLAGHLDTSSGGPAVFWSLDDLQVGDELTVSYGNGDSYTFLVEGQELYEHDAQGPIIDRIFGDSITADLNLVTCDGAWDHGKATYSHRLVVFSTLAPEKTVRNSAESGSAPVQ